MLLHTVFGPAVLREMKIVDLPSVLAIEHQSQMHPWEKAHFISSIQAPSHHAQILVHEKKSIGVLGYYVCSTAMDEAEILNIAIAPKMRGQHLGKQLLQHLCKQFDENIHTVFLEVRESNSPAIALYRSTGFNDVGKRLNYYPHQQTREDAIIFAKQLVHDQGKTS